MTSEPGLGRSCIRLIASLSLLGVATLCPPSAGHAQSTLKPCENTGSNQVDLQNLINTQGLKDFVNPPEPTAPPTSPATRLDLVVDYADVDVAGCITHLRTYNGNVIGPTIRAKPGDTIHIRLINKLHDPKPGEFPDPPQHPPPPGHSGGAHQFSFNITNLHTHGLHVAPQGPVDPKTGTVPFESDNVMLELLPGGQQDYRIQLDPDHPAGTFWYHAHVHGSTAVQLSSGMAGALIIEGGTKDNGDLDTVPAIGKVKNSQKIFVLQQLGYDKTGKIETFSLQSRPTLINGQLVPVIRMRPGEVQRWRFVHAGIQENVALALDGHPIHEVAADGITLGRSVPWAEAPASGALNTNTLFLLPGYRSDVLVQARQPEPGRRYFLRKLQLTPDVSIQAQERAFARAAARPLTTLESITVPVDPADFAPGQILAELVIEGEPVTDQTLPTADDLKGLIPKELPDITPEEIANGNAPQSVEFKVGSAKCNAADGACDQTCPGPGCALAFQVNNMQFSTTPKVPLVLKLNTNGKPTAAVWTITTASGFHPFHIHVNPFQVDRKEPNTAGAIVNATVWKDTIAAIKNTLPPLRMRYTRFKGTFVLHCHILQHEDQGMMQLVEIAD
jgi:FtsP/CotA-like multicopper oxidase with cupredoxin domain